MPIAKAALEILCNVAVAVVAVDVDVDVVVVVVVVVAVVVVVVEDYVAAGTYCSVRACACMLLHAVLLLLAVAVFFSYGQFLP